MSTTMLDPRYYGLSREDARAAGLKVYYADRQCSFEHFPLRYVKGDTCVECKKTYRQRMADSGPRCSVLGCGKKRDTRGFCPAHYSRWKDHGDPLAGGPCNGDRLKWIADHVDYQGDDCLLWPFGRQEGKDGAHRGYFSIRADGKNLGAHVFMCRLVHGEKPDNKDLAAHSCGNGHRGCVNPKHLRWATYKENVEDAFLHGTVRVGEDHHYAKLTEDDVRRIRVLGRTLTQKSIGKLFGVTRHTIARVLSGDRWKHVE